LRREQPSARHEQIVAMDGGIYGVRVYTRQGYQDQYLVGHLQNVDWRLPHPLLRDSPWLEEAAVHAFGPRKHGYGL